MKHVVSEEWDALFEGLSVLVVLIAVIYMIGHLAWSVVR